MHENKSCVWCNSIGRQRIKNDSYSYLTDIGKRPTNEDSLICIKLSRTCMLAGVIDGCGAAGGAAEIVRDKLLDNVSQMGFSSENAISLKQLKATVVEVNNYLVDYRRYAPKVGSCIVTICQMDWESQTISLAHCGDTRAYLITKEGVVKQMTHDHSYIGNLLRAGSITESDAKDHSMHHLISKSIGCEYLDEGSDFMSVTTTCFSPGESLLFYPFRDNVVIRIMQQLYGLNYKSERLTL